MTCYGKIVTFGVSELAKHLHSVPHLKALHLADTQMGEEEVTALAHVLLCVPKLSDLRLDQNPLGRGVTELIKCLRSSPQGFSLSLTGGSTDRERSD